MDMKKANPFLRLLWSCIYMTLISYTIFMVVTLWGKFLIHPTVTTMVSSTYPVNKVPFPAVSICSINKISKRRAQNAANRIGNITRLDSSEIMNYIHFVGQLYDFDFEQTSVSQLLHFQNILDTLGINLTLLAKRIAVPCEELLKSCRWRSMEINCSAIFEMRRTHNGYCCLFNYIKRTRNMATEEKPTTTDAGLGNGLHVAINNHVWDYFYTTLSSPGVMINIFVPSDYPDKASGSVTEILTQPNSENFIEIVPWTLTSVKDVADYPVEKRGCLFDYERATSFFGEYSQSDCNVDCRVMSIKAMCECIPFMIPLNSGSTVCTLADLPCINRYKDKWNSFFPEGDDSGKYLEKERQDSLRCDQKCYSSCSETVYEAFTNSFPIFNESEREDNITHIYVYYPNRFSKLYRQDVVYYWFEVLSNFGGIFGIFVGWSLISLMQFSFYYGKKLVEKLIQL